MRLKSHNDCKIPISPSVRNKGIQGLIQYYYCQLGKCTCGHKPQVEI